MKQALLFIALFALTAAASAQTVKAITQHGETVVLFENGTWKYEKEIKAGTSVETPTAVTLPAVVSASSSNKGHIGIDATKEATSEKVELYNAVSKKLSRFFGEEKGRVRCSATASNNKGEISLNFEFMMPLGDANRYFGYSTLDRKVSFMLSDGSTLNHVFSKNTEEKFIEKWNISYYKASIIISHDDVIKILQNNTLRMTVDWKKVEEEYLIDNVTGLQAILAEVL